MGDKIEKETKKVSSIEIDQLFNLYDHRIKLNSDGITIIHGQNGVGKTVILTLIDAFFGGNWYLLSKFPFKEFRIVFSDSTILKISQNTPQKETKKIVFEYQDNRIQIASSSLDFDRLAKRIEREAPYLDQIGSNSWTDMRTGQVLTSWEVVSVYGKNVDIKQAFPKGTEWLTKLKDTIQVSFIKTQRLEYTGSKQLFSPMRRRPSRDNQLSVVNNYAEKMQEIHTAALSDYGKVSQNLDQTFPNRLLQKDIKTLNHHVLKQKMDEIEEKRNKLKEIKVLEEDYSGFSYASLNLDNLSEIHYQVLSTYVEDSERKLKTLESISNKVELMLNKINEKFQHKQLSLDSEYGLVIHGDKGDRLDLSGLSSGEQHELVLIFDLLFNTSENSLILIDEPELSLHISWQRKFLDDLKDITSLIKLNVIVATHAPNVIEGYDNLMIELKS